VRCARLVASGGWFGLSPPLHLPGADLRRGYRCPLARARLPRASRWHGGVLEMTPSRKRVHNGCSSGQAGTRRRFLFYFRLPCPCACTVRCARASLLRTTRANAAIAANSRSALLIACSASLTNSPNNVLPQAPTFQRVGRVVVGLCLFPPPQRLLAHPSIYNAWHDAPTPLARRQRANASGNRRGLRARGPARPLATETTCLDTVDRRWCQA